MIITIFFIHNRVSFGGMIEIKKNMYNNKINLGIQYVIMLYLLKNILKKQSNNPNAYHNKQLKYKIGFTAFKQKLC